MGICNSCEATAVSTAAALAGTAKLVLEDGRLQEFDRPVKVSEVLRQSQGWTGGRSRAFFVCDSDAMGMEGLLPAVNAEEELQPGQLYFLLPQSMLRRPLRPQDMADLAVKANSALVKSSSDASCGCCDAQGTAIAPLAFPTAPAAAAASGSGLSQAVAEQKTGPRVRAAKRAPRHLSLLLGAIPEFEEEEDDDAGLINA